MWDNARAMRRLSSWLIFLVVLILLGAGGVWVMNSPYFPIKQVKIDGEITRSNEQALQAVAAKYIRGNIFKADLNGAQAAFQALPWVEKALVRRKLPDTVEIVLEEHIPIARWKQSGLVDSKGKIFQAATDEHFPDFDGQAGTEKLMTEHLREYQQKLEPLGISIEKLHYTPRSAWLLTLGNGIEIRLGREHEGERLDRCIQIWPSILKAESTSLQYVDMRYRDGFAVRRKIPDPEHIIEPLPDTAEIE